MNKAPIYLLIAAMVLSLGVGYIGCKKSDDSPTEPEGPTGNINANASITPVSRTNVQGTMVVTDQTGAAVTGLTAQNIRAILRWGTPKVAVLDSILGVVVLQPLSASGKSIAVGMTMDYSGSMYVGTIDPVTGRYQRIKDMESAVKTFVNAMATSDVAEIIKFGDYSRVDVVQSFTSNKTLLLRAADTLSFDRGLTALYKSIVRGILDASAQSSASYARAVVAFTDGGENDSYISRDSVFSASRRLGIPVYTVGLLDSIYHSTPPGLYSSSERDLVQIADTTGGLYFYAPNAAQLSQVYTRISGALANSYSVSITWPSTGLPPSGTTVTAVITVVVGGVSSTFIKPYVIP